MNRDARSGAGGRDPRDLVLRVCLAGAERRRRMNEFTDRGEYRQLCVSRADSSLGVAFVLPGEAKDDIRAGDFVYAR
jgi:hypothetical protein